MSEVEESRGEGVGRGRVNPYDYEDSGSDFIEEEEEEEEEKKEEEEEEEKVEVEAVNGKKEDGEQMNGEVSKKEGDEENEGTNEAPAQNGDAHEDENTEKKKKKKKRDGDKKSKKKKKDKGNSSTDTDSEEEDPAPTPPLFNGHALTNGIISNRLKGERKRQEEEEEEEEEEEIGISHHKHHHHHHHHDHHHQMSETESHSDHEFIGKEEFHSLRDVYNNNSGRGEGSSAFSKEPRAQTPLTDEEELAGVNVKQLRVSYLNQAQEKRQQQQQQHQVIENNKVEVNRSVNITNLVDTYSTPVSRTPTPSRPDDLTPVSLRSLKSAYEASATGGNSAVGGNSSGSSGSPGGGSPAPKEELNISLHQLREEYCRTAQDGLSRSHTPTRASPETGVSIRQLTRSMTDLRGLGQETSRSVIDGDRSALASVNVKALTRSFSDLTRLSDAIGTTSSNKQFKENIGNFSISVRALRASYGDLPRAVRSSSSPPVPRPRTTMQVAQVSNDCKQCGKQVFQMEKIVAEKASWHKNCFRCAECNCILTLETYQSHEGILYCKVHFKALFQPKAVLEDPGEKYMSRRPKMIILESQPQELPPDVVRSGNNATDALEDLSTANLKKKFMMFEAISTTDEDLDDAVALRRSKSLLNRARGGEEDYGVENSELGEYGLEENEEEEEEEEEEEDENEDPDQAKIRKKVKATSFSGMQDIQALKAAKKRKEMMARKRREEVAKFRQMLCAGKNIHTREVFEGIDDFDFDKPVTRKQQIKLERAEAASELRDRFESGEVSLDKRHTDERKELEEIFKEADTASRARNLFKQIDSAAQDEPELGQLRRSRSTAEARKEHRLSIDGRQIRNFAAQGEEEEAEEKMHIECSSIQNKFKFFATYEDRVKEADKNRKKVFRFTPPREDEKGIDVEEQELGRDPNYVRCTDNYEDEVDCRKTKSVLAMFRKMEMQNEDGDKVLRPLKQFTPPPEGEEYSDEDEYTDEEYSSDEDSDDDEDEEEDENDKKIPKYKDEILEMLSARKAASLRAKFEKWETEVDRNNEFNYNDDEDEECMPSIDTARNLRAMFENKAQEASRPATERPKMKVNRFV